MKLANIQVLLMVMVCLRPRHLILGCCSEEKFTKTADYQSDQIPPGENGDPLLVSSSINVRNILDISETKQQVSLETTLRFYWKDFRLVPHLKYLQANDSFGRYVNLHPRIAKTMWMPDIFIDQAINLRQPTYFTQPASVRLYENSLIRYSSRMNFDVACAMDFHKFPMDVQVCNVRFESFAYSSSQMQLKWLNRSLSQVNPNIQLDQFDFRVRLEDDYKTDSYDILYPGLIMNINLSRESGYHLIQTYVPSTLFVVLGWLGLFIPISSVPGRVGMGMTTILTLTAMFSGVRQNVPKVSYVSYLDVWMVTCLIFVNSCMFEFVIILILKEKGKEKLGGKVEKFSQALIPGVFLLFNLIYWPVVCSL